MILSLSGVRFECEKISVEEEFACDGGSGGVNESNSNNRNQRKWNSYGTHTHEANDNQWTLPITTRILTLNDARLANHFRLHVD